MLLIHSFTRTWSGEGGGFRRLTKQTTFARETKHESPVTMYFPALRVQSGEAYPPVLPVL